MPSLGEVPVVIIIFLVMLFWFEFISRLIPLLAPPLVPFVVIVLFVIMLKLEVKDWIPGFVFVPFALIMFDAKMLLFELDWMLIPVLPEEDPLVLIVFPVTLFCALEVKCIP